MQEIFFSCIFLYKGLVHVLVCTRHVDGKCQRMTRVFPRLADGI